MATALIYTVEIRGVHETNWKLLKDKLREKYWSWDSTAFPDGEYRAARDRVGSARQSARRSAFHGDGERSVSDRQYAAAHRQPGGERSPAASCTPPGRAADALSDIKKAEYSLDGGDWTLVAPVTGLSDSHDWLTI